MSLKQTISMTLRKAGLIDFADYLRFLYILNKNGKANKRYAKKNPLLKIPADRHIYEIFGTVDYYQYFRTGEKAAQNIIDLVSKYKNIHEISFLEWGCGVGRILSHLPNLLLAKDCKFYGSDINVEMIDWCRANFHNIEFYQNSLTPPLVFDDASIDVAYCTSVFTHLSEEYQEMWLEEISRVLKRDGIFILTVHGDYYAERKLIPEEFEQYKAGELVVRLNTAEGSRTTTTFQNEKYMREKLLKGFTILEHIPSHDLELAGSQDIWIIQNKALA